MDILLLHDTTFVPEQLVEGLTSTIWTERLRGNGEFILKTPNVAATQTLLPKGSLVSHLETNEIMRVESHTIDKDDDGNAVLTITGRSLTSILENRIVVASDYGASWTSLTAYTTPAVLSLLLWTHLANNSGQDPVRATGSISAANKIPNAVVVDNTTVNDVGRFWSFEAGVLSDIVTSIIQQGNYGLRCIRPPVTGRAVSVDVGSFPSRGQVTREASAVINGLIFEVYNGTRRARNDTTTPVIFDYLSGHVENPQYLSSQKEFKNVAVVISSEGVFEIPSSGTPTGLNRRALFVDVGGKTEETSLSDYMALINQKGLAELAAHNEALLFDGEISAIAPYSYGIDYFLGDFVTLSAEYGFEATMLVTEYVRTEDSTGDRGYPTLALPV